MTPDEAAELFSVRKKTFLRWAREKGIERVKVSS
ncbi:MAG: helix-turn-helix domain-containing protein, partial [Desulfomonilaceae bacterium]